MRRIALLLKAAKGTAALLAIFYPNIMVEAADVAARVEGENFATKPVGASVISGAAEHSGGAALKFTQNNTASHTVNCSATCDVVLMASGGQSGVNRRFPSTAHQPRPLPAPTSELTPSMSTYPPGLEPSTSRRATRGPGGTQSSTW
jgi:hypothetical protein